MEPSQRNDLFVPEPALPLANSDATWLDTDPAAVMWRGLDVTQLPDMDGFIGELFFDEEVTLYVETASSFTGALQVMNNGGDGDVIPANTPTAVRIGFLGRRTHLKLRTGDTPPTVWHANGKVVKGDLGAPGNDTISYGVTLASPGLQGEQGDPGQPTLLNLFLLGTVAGGGASFASIQQTNIPSMIALISGYAGHDNTFIRFGAGTVRKLRMSVCGVDDNGGSLTLTIGNLVATANVNGEEGMGTVNDLTHSNAGVTSIQPVVSITGWQAGDKIFMNATVELS